MRCVSSFVSVSNAMCAFFCLPHVRRARSTVSELRVLLYSSHLLSIV